MAGSRPLSGTANKSPLVAASVLGPWLLLQRSLGMFKHFVGLGLIGGSYDITWKGKVYDGMALGMGMTFGYVKKITSKSLS